MNTQNLAADYLNSLIEGIRENIHNGHPFGYDKDREEYGESAEVTAHDWLEDILDIEYIISSDKQYIGARLLLSYGGPTTWLDTRRRTLTVTWDGVKTDTVPLEFTEAVDEALEELWDMN